MRFATLPPRDRHDRLYSRRARQRELGASGVRAAERWRWGIGFAFCDVSRAKTARRTLIAQPPEERGVEGSVLHRRVIGAVDCIGLELRGLPEVCRCIGKGLDRGLVLRLGRFGVLRQSAQYGDALTNKRAVEVTNRQAFSDHVLEIAPRLELDAIELASDSGHPCPRAGRVEDRRPCPTTAHRVLRVRHGCTEADAHPEMVMRR